MQCAIVTHADSDFCSHSCPENPKIKINIKKRLRPAFISILKQIISFHFSISISNLWIFWLQAVKFDLLQFPGKQETCNVFFYYLLGLFCVQSMCLRFLCFSLSYKLFNLVFYSRLELCTGYVSWFSIIWNLVKLCKKTLNFLKTINKK